MSSTASDSVDGVPLMTPTKVRRWSICPEDSGNASTASTISALWEMPLFRARRLIFLSTAAGTMICLRTGIRRTLSCLSKPVSEFDTILGTRGFMSRLPLQLLNSRRARVVGKDGHEVLARPVFHGALFYASEVSCARKGSV